MLEEALAEGDRCLLFTQFKEMGSLLRTHLKELLGGEILFLHGGVPQKDREDMVLRFQEASADSPKIFVLSLKAGGTGLNLTAANRVFHYDRWWNPAVEDQATDRAFRIGQERNVFVHKFVCTGTLEERIQEMLERKRKVAESLLVSGEGWITELTNEELRRLLTLDRQEALA
jgi:SNF2 family DNA or RNA helicase